ncbi:hypothetical protein KSP39_PZI007901 [Platanthera zijinensis]|uniref:Uncharacterized protein n=1 Tax=Platanthera zijinensis TaxID=2320716 RepID=A0AAP0G8T9_9ASPA
MAPNYGGSSLGTSLVHDKNFITFGSLHVGVYRGVQERSWPGSVHTRLESGGAQSDAAGTTTAVLESDASSRKVGTKGALRPDPRGGAVVRSDFARLSQAVVRLVWLVLRGSGAGWLVTECGLEIQTARLIKVSELEMEQRETLCPYMHLPVIEPPRANALVSYSNFRGASFPKTASTYKPQIGTVQICALFLLRVASFRRYLGNSAGSGTVFCSAASPLLPSRTICRTWNPDYNNQFSASFFSFVNSSNPINHRSANLQSLYISNQGPPEV